jgi:hypothetical protein
MLNHTMRRADEEGIQNIEPTHRDARELPYPDATYLITVLARYPIKT